MYQILLIILFATNAFSQSSLFLENPETVSKKLGYKDPSLSQAFYSNEGYKYPYRKDSVFFDNYYFINPTSSKVDLRLNPCNGKICLTVNSKKICDFAEKEIFLLKNKSAFLIDSKLCRIKGTNLVTLKRISTLVILDKADNKFIVTGDLLKASTIDKK